MRQPTRHKRRGPFVGRLPGLERRIPRKRVQNQISDSDSEQPERISRDTSARSSPLGACWDLGESPIPRAGHGRGHDNLESLRSRRADVHTVCGQGEKGCPIFCHFYLGSPVEAQWPCSWMEISSAVAFVCRPRRDNNSDWSRGDQAVMIRPDQNPGDALTLFHDTNMTSSCSKECRHIRGVQPCRLGWTAGPLSADPGEGPPRGEILPNILASSPGRAADTACGPQCNAGAAPAPLFRGSFSTVVWWLVLGMGKLTAPISVVKSTQYISNAVLATFSTETARK